MPTPASSWLFASTYHALLLGGLFVAVTLGWTTWRRRPSAEARYVWLGALSALATLMLVVPFSLLAHSRGLAPVTWVGPFDRLLGVTILVMLGWTLTRGPRSWRVFLAAGFAATAVTYVTWAPTWAEEFTLRPDLALAPAATTPVGGLARIWDAWMIVLAVSVGAALVRTSPRAPRWLLAVVGALAVGSLFELGDPIAAFPVWSRLGTLVAGAIFVAAAVTQVLRLGSDAEAAPVEAEPVEGARPRPVPVETDDERTLDGLATQVLFEAMGRTGAEPVLFCLVSPEAAVTVWGVGHHGEGSRRVGDLPLTDHPTLARALASGGLRLSTSKVARDVTRLYGLMGVSGEGPVLLQPVAATGTQALIVAGREEGRWRESDQAALVTVSRRAARLLEQVLSPEPEARIEHVYDVLETQTESVTRLARILEGLSERLASLEDAAARGTVIDAPETVLTRADFDARVLQYEAAIEALPWGILVCDQDGRVVFANGATSRLLGVDGLYPEQPVAELVPDPERLAFALDRCAQRAGADAAPVEVLFESPGVGIELEPLYDERHGYLGAVGVIRSRSQSAVADTTVMVALAEALRSPMTCILGYSDLLANGQGLSQEQLDRYLQRIDANLARMSISLENLVTVLEMTDEPDMAPESVDVATALAAARDRCRSQFDEKSLVLELGAMEELPPVSADPAALGQILDNLLANAAQRSPQGGDVTATAEVREDVSGGRAVVIALADRGQAFTGVRGIIELDEASGANVSLTVVRMLAERQGGKAWAEAAEGRTRFLARLPVRRVVARPTTAATEAAREASAPPIQEPLPATT